MSNFLKLGIRANNDRLLSIWTLSVTAFCRRGVTNYTEVSWSGRQRCLGTVSVISGAVTQRWATGVREVKIPAINSIENSGKFENFPELQNAGNGWEISA